MSGRNPQSQSIPSSTSLTWPILTKFRKDWNRLWKKLVSSQVFNILLLISPAFRSLHLPRDPREEKREAGGGRDWVRTERPLHFLPGRVLWELLWGLAGHCPQHCPPRLPRTHWFLPHLGESRHLWSATEVYQWQHQSGQWHLLSKTREMRDELGNNGWCCCRTVSSPPSLSRTSSLTASLREFWNFASTSTRSPCSCSQNSV